MPMWQEQAAEKMREDEKMTLAALKCKQLKMYLFLHTVYIISVADKSACTKKKKNTLRASCIF